ncbi:MAG: 3-methyl-2-oxobutanoate hydroxymethyltransferase [Verrucomicrobiota bacterium]
MTATEKANAFRRRKGGKKIAMLTAYDYPMARLLDESGIDSLLVGDSLGMVVLGFPDTTHVTMAHMLHHIAAVARAKPRALIIGDMPIHSYDTAEMAVANAEKLAAAGADAVKLEGGISEAEKVRAIVATGIPVIGHLGMLPQHVLEEGGYKKKGKTDEQRTALLGDAHALVSAGVSGIVLESVVPATARFLTEQISVPTIGIGCGNGTCDGEVAVITDLIGSFPWFVPPFAKPEADVAAALRDAAGKFIARVMQ